MIPVLLIIFNRTEEVKALIGALEKVKPLRMYIAADGPRSTVPSDALTCAAAREVVQTVPWPCEVITHFSDVNQGVDPAVENAISWFFRHETEGIILEDDCIPHPDFFTFAGEMLSRYRNDERVMMISGDNFQNGVKRGNGSYYFSNYANTWGWATWRRTWNLYDTSLAALPEFIEQNTIATLLPPKEEQRYWIKYLRKLHAGVRTAWDAKLMFALWIHNGLTLVPNANLVTNIGFGANATHTAGDTSMSIGSRALLPPYRAPSKIEANDAADRYLFHTVFRITLRDKVRYILTILHEKARSLSLSGPKTTAH